MLGAHCKISLFHAAKVRLVFLLLFAALLSSRAIFADSYLEFKPGFFYPSHSLIRDIYGMGSFSFEFEYDWKSSMGLGVWANYGFLRKSGHSTSSGSPTQMQFQTLTAGAKYFFPKRSFAQWYLGAAPKLYFSSFVDDSLYVKTRRRRCQLGATAALGVQLFIQNFFFDPAIAFSYGKIHHRSNGVSSQGYDAYLNGLFFSLGIGCQFPVASTHQKSPKGSSRNNADYQKRHVQNFPPSEG